MNIFKLGTITTAVCLLCASAIQSYAIEGLHLSLECSNVVLTWPSVEGETYIVQYRGTLDPSNSWQTLTSSLAAESGMTNTTFVHSNVVLMPNCGAGSSFAAMSFGGGKSSSIEAAVEDDTPTEPVAVATNGLGGYVPLQVFPPGFDMSGYYIFDPSSGSLVSGALLNSAGGGMQANDIEFPPGEEGAVYTNSSGRIICETGFYRVVRNGAYIVKQGMLTNSTISGVVSVEYECGNADNTGTNVIGDFASATLLVDGQKYRGGGTTASHDIFALDTSHMENGTHYLQVATTWANPDNSDNNNLYFTKNSPYVAITVSNQIYYPEWEPAVGETGVSAYFLRTANADTDWSIRIYNQNSDLLQTLSGHTSNGLIEAYWNMLDTNGVAHTNAEVDPEFISVAALPGPVVMALPKKKQTKNDWPEHGKWTVCYQDTFKFDYSPDNDMQDSINYFALTAAKYGGYYLWYPTPGQTNDIGQTYPLRYQTLKHYDTNLDSLTIAKDEELLEKMLSNTNSRNFYYLGHGSSSGIGGYLTAKELQSVIKHRYRFVFIHGCDTALGDIDNAFGINGPGHFSVDYYSRTGRRPAAYVANTKKVLYDDGQPISAGGVDYDATIPWQVPFFIINFLFYWDADLVGWGLQDSLNQAAADLPPVLDFEVQPGEGIVIYGYADMRIDEFNHKSDW